MGAFRPRFAILKLNKSSLFLNSVSSISRNTCLEIQLLPKSKHITVIGQLTLFTDIIATHINTKWSALYIYVPGSRDRWNHRALEGPIRALLYLPHFRAVFKTQKSLLTVYSPTVA